MKILHVVQALSLCMAFCVSIACSANLQGQLVVESVLGTLSHNSITAVAGDTINGVNNATLYRNTFGDPTRNWGNELVYQFSLAEGSDVRIDLTSQSDDVDIFLITDLVSPFLPLKTSTEYSTGKTMAYNTIDYLTLNTAAPESFGYLPAGTYYLSVDTYNGVDGTTTPNTADFTFDIEVDEPSEVPDLAAGYVRLAASGLAPRPTTPDGDGEKYWEFTYGEDTENLPAIESILITLGDVRERFFDPTAFKGDFVYTTGLNVSSVTATFLDEDEDVPALFGQLLLEFPVGEFLPGESVQFGVDLNLGTFPPPGENLQLLNQPIMATVTFEEGTVSTFMLDQGGIINVETEDEAGISYSDMEIILNPSSADFDNDGDVDGSDFLAWQTGFGITSGATAAMGDANGDGVVDANDFDIWESQYGSSTGNASGNGSLAGSSVPEPAAWVIVAIASLVVLPCLLRKAIASRRAQLLSVVVILCLVLQVKPMQATVVEQYIIDTDPFDISISGSYDEQGYIGNIVNDYTAQANYTLGNITWDGYAWPIENVVGSGDFPSWGLELSARILHQDSNGAITGFDVPLGSGRRFGPGPEHFFGTMPHLAGLQIEAGDQIFIELFEAYDDFPDAADAIWSSLSFSFTDEGIPAAVTAPVAEGFIRVDTAGLDSYNINVDDTVDDYWGITYGSGANDGTKPSIESIVIDLSPLGSADDFAFDMLTGPLDITTTNGVDDPITVRLANPDSNFDQAFGKLILSFEEDDFRPGDSIRFGVDMDGLPFDGLYLKDLNPGIDITINFDSGTSITGQLTEHGFIAPGQFQFSYTDLEVSAATISASSVPEPSTLALVSLVLAIGAGLKFRRVTVGK